MGETIGAVILGSDETHLTNHQGDKTCHAVYLSCGNIRKEVRNKGNANAWRMIGQIPSVTFKNEALQGVLYARLYHVCMDIILENLKKASRKAVEMIDSSGQKRDVRTVLFSHIADLPEQLMISCTAKNQAPSSFAQQHQFGDSTAQPLRTGAGTLRALEYLKETFPPDERLSKNFLLACKTAGLNGVLEPYWRDWQFADPCEFLTPDSLHQWHILFKDHLLSWARKLIGDAEFDKRLAAIQHRIGFRHFPDGITKFKQHTGRETRDLERIFLGVIAGHPQITTSAMRAFRSFLDFVYLGQYPRHTSRTLRAMDNALTTFHESKCAFVPVRDGPRQQGEFRIPKLELMHHVTRLIHLLGSADQFTSDTTEKLHILMAKVAYTHTNRKQFIPQMCDFLNRLERLLQFERFLVWRGTDTTLLLRRLAKCLREEWTKMCTVDDFKIDIDPSPFEDEEDLEYISKGARPGFLPVKSDFHKVSATNDTTAFSLTKTPTNSYRSLQEFCRAYSFHDLSHSFSKFWKDFRLANNSGGLVLPPFNSE